MKKNGNVLKERLKSGTSSYYQERVLSRERILNQECALNHLEIIERFFFVFDHLGVLRLKTPRKERNGFYSERNGTEQIETRTE